MGGAKVSALKRLPPLSTLPYFEAAGRTGSFRRAAAEFCRTPTAVSARIRTLEAALGFPLFERKPQGVHLSRRGEAYLAEVQRILSDIEIVTDRHRDGESAGGLRIVAAEVLAEKWLMPKLAQFRRAYPEFTIRFETDHDLVDPGRRQFDVWVAFTGEVEGDLHVETLFEETLVPVCSPGFLAERERPETPADLLAVPLLYDLALKDGWPLWFASHGAPAPDLSLASGFRLYSTTIQAAVSGLGVALGRLRMISTELEQETLVKFFDSPVIAPARYVLVTPPGSKERSDIQAFRSWILEQAGSPGGREVAAALSCTGG